MGNLGGSWGIKYMRYGKRMGTMRGHWSYRDYGDNEVIEAIGVMIFMVVMGVLGVLGVMEDAGANPSSDSSLQGGLCWCMETIGGHWGHEDHGGNGGHKLGTGSVQET